MNADAARDITTAAPRRRWGARWLAVLAAAFLAAAVLAAGASTHLALSADAVGWSGAVPGHSAGLAPITLAQRNRIGPVPGYRQILWASRPGGEITAGFTLHNGGPVPVTILGVALRGYLPGVIRDLSPAGALGPGTDGRLARFHAMALGPGDSAAVGLTERVICDPTVREDARLPGGRGDYSWLGDATSPVVVRYRALGVTMSQTLALTAPVLVVQPYTSCR
jgi:hypothetical protein